MNKLNKTLVLLCCVLALVKSGHQSSADQNFSDRQSDQHIDLNSNSKLSNKQLNSKSNQFSNHKSNQQTNKETDQQLNDEKNRTDEQIDAKDLLKNFLLKKLDISSLPTDVKNTKVPKFLLDIFETSSVLRTNQIYLPHDSNAIRSHPLLIDENTNSKSKQKRSGFLMKFNVVLPEKEMLNAGELRLFLNRNNNCSSRKQRITINQILQQKNLDENRKSAFTTIQEENDLVYREIDMMIIKYERHNEKPTWLQFDILPSIETWIKNSSLNYGLLIKSFCVDREEFNLNADKFVDNFVIQPSNGLIDFDLNKSTMAKDEIYENYKPILLTYSNFKPVDFRIQNFDLIMNKRKRHIDSESNSSTPDDLNKQVNNWKNNRTKSCARHSMYVDFREIKWNDWIVSPNGFDAFFCYGECSSTSINDSKPHSIIQNIYHKTIKPSIVPPPCCVASEFTPIVFMFKENNNTSVLKVYNDMVVTKCKCA